MDGMTREREYEVEESQVAQHDENEAVQPQVADPKTEIEDLFDHLRDYLDTGRELFALKMLNRFITATSSAIVWSAFVLIALLVLLFVSIGGALWIGAALESNYLGFFIIAGFYAVIALVIYFGRDKLFTKPLKNKMIDNMLND
jgi:hypothetical protein